MLRTGGRRVGIEAEGRGGLTSSPFVCRAAGGLGSGGPTRLRGRHGYSQQGEAERRDQGIHGVEMRCDACLKLFCAFRRSAGDFFFSAVSYVRIQDV